MNETFKNKVAWVIGASSGIGEEIARQVNSLGGFVILSARNVAKLESVKSTFNYPDNVYIIPLDLENQTNFESKVQEAKAFRGSIDFVFNNGGLSQRGEVHETDIAIDRRIMEINYFGNIALAKAVLPVFRAQKSGHFIVMSSIAGKFGFYLRSAYAASKHALQGFYESLLLEEAKNNIFVTLAYPGKINTEISKSALNAQGNAHGVMDHNQETGMPVEKCVQILLKAVRKRKKSILIGNKEIWAVYIKRFSPRLFWRIIKNQSAT
ncbi:SDR family NAD(P)-dependent oxidoreductase [Crocinitomix algicola]|uniref:SDR family NAD(P)-dependent oxidoreductase n=1 Tax=Crocinitomix algicola TaxID=1740263 RepID=UPI00082C0220|nr:SDR family NAD(P)-dependent oxidoreductase [Crocinitomix algicola]